LRNQLQRISGTRKASAVAVERVCRTVLDRNPEELYDDTYVEARKHVGKRIDTRVASFDLSFSDPKSVSLLAAGSSPEVRAEVQAARHVAIRKVLGWLEGITSPQPAFLDRHGRPGYSAMAEYRRQRATDWHIWKPTLDFRIAAVLAAGVSTGCRQLRSPAPAWHGSPD
jgi:hypothetical protein